jgi:hypothetical protein
MLRADGAGDAQSARVSAMRWDAIRAIDRTSRVCIGATTASPAEVLESTHSGALRQSAGGGDLFLDGHVERLRGLQLRPCGGIASRTKGTENRSRGRMIPIRVRIIAVRIRAIALRRRKIALKVRKLALALQIIPHGVATSHHVAAAHHAATLLRRT